MAKKANLEDFKEETPSSLWDFFGIGSPKTEYYSRQEQILTEGILFPNALVDYIHGQLPKKVSGVRRQYFHELLISIIYSGEKLLELVCSSEEDEIKLKSQMWNQLCQMRRITQRIVHALNGYHHRAAIETGATGVSRIEIQRLCNLNSQINNKILNESLSMRTLKKANWFNFAIAYEATLLLRNKGAVGSAIELANACMEMDLIKEKPPKIIRGLFSFNQLLFDEHDEDGSEGGFKKIKPHELLFRLSNRISRNSKNAASQGLNLNEKDALLPFQVMNELTKRMDRQKFKFTPSSILHLEGLVRVYAYQTAWTYYVPITSAWRAVLTSILPKVYDKILPDLVDSSGLSDWIKEAMHAKIEQDAGGLFSDFAPSVFIDNAYFRESNFVEKVDYQKTLERVRVWPIDWDSPAHIRKDFRSRAIEDMYTRMSSLDNDSPNLTKLSSLLGNSSSPNALTKDSLARWFAGDKTGDANNQSLHLQHFPQGNINQAQVAISMAYMQYLMRGKNGIFDNLVDTMRIDRSDKKKPPSWKLDKRKAKPQFTIGHFAKGKKETQRAELSRVNRLDEMMYVASALNFVFEVIDSELKNPVTRFDSLLRQCKVDGLKIISDDYNLHLHELFYYAQESSQSPMRIVDPQTSHGDNDDLSKSKMVDSILRTSFVRLYCLSLRTEHLSRILIERPLREPFLSSCVLIVDQARLLLDLMHSDWKIACIASSEEASRIESTKFEKDIFDKLSTLRNVKRQNYFDILDSQDCLNRKKKEEVKPDVAIEYLLSNSPTLDEIEELVSQSKQRLDLSSLLGNQWDVLLKESLHLRYESDISTHNPEVDILSIAPKEDSEKEEIPSNQKSVIEIFKTLQAGVSRREWIMWARLVWYPTAFVGRVLVSGNTPWDLNRDENKNARKLVFGKLEKEFYSNSDKHDSSINHATERFHQSIKILNKTIKTLSKYVE